MTDPLDPKLQPALLTFPWPAGAVWRRWLASAVLIGIALYVLFLIRELAVPMMLAFLLATVLDPVVDRMETRGWKRPWATGFIFGSFLILVVLILIWAWPYALDQIQGLETKFDTYFPDRSHKGIIDSLHKMHAPEWLTQACVQAIGGTQDAFQRSAKWATEHGMSMVGNLIWLIIVPVVGFYATRDYHLILAKGMVLAPKDRRADLQMYVVEVGTIFGKYLRGLVIVSALNGTATWILLTALRVPSSLVLGMIAGVLYSVPYVGAMITIVLTAAVAFVGGGVNLMLLAVGLSMILHQVIFDQVISPRLLGGHVGLHPIFAIIALLAGNILLGIIGMILAVPVAACLQIGVLAIFPKLRMDLHVEPTTAASDDNTSAVHDMNKAGDGEPVHGDATADLHQNVIDAVDKAEAEAEGNHENLTPVTE